MSLQDQMASAVEAEKERRARDTAKWKARSLEEKRRIVAKTFGTATGGQVKRLDVNTMEDEFVLPEGAIVTDDQIIVDGVEFGLSRERYSVGAYVAPMLTCPECGERHTGSHLYRSKDYKTNTYRIGDSQLAQLAKELKTQRAGDHKCYQTGMYAVASAARSAAYGLKDTSPRDMLRRADAYLLEKGAWS